MLNVLWPALFLSAALAAPAAAGDSAPGRGDRTAQVMIVGLFHLSNPGQDLYNVQADDVLTDRRQAELARIASGLARFAPTTVMVEWPAAVTDQRYAQYRAGSLPESRNEVVQLGFRLAGELGLKHVHGIDVAGDFPFAPVKAFADERGLADQLDRAMAQAGAVVQEINDRLARGSIGSVLRYMNTAQRAAAGHAFYMGMLRYGDGIAQPGVDLVSAWYARNLGICARLLQALPPAGRAVVFYGDGHAYLLRQCVIETPGVQLVEANDFIPE